MRSYFVICVIAEKIRDGKESLYLDPKIFAFILLEDKLPITLGLVGFSCLLSAKHTYNI